MNAIKGDTGDLSEIRDAVRYIRDENLRRDFENLVDGAEYGLVHDKELADHLMHILSEMAAALARTITPEVTWTIMRAVSSDATRLSIGIGFGLGIDGWHKDSRCNFNTQTCESGHPGFECKVSQCMCINANPVDVPGTVSLGYRWGVTV